MNAKKMGDRGFFHMMERMTVQFDGYSQEVICHGSFNDNLIISSSRYPKGRMLSAEEHMIVSRPFCPIVCNFQ